MDESSCPGMSRVADYLFAELIISTLKNKNGPRGANVQKALGHKTRWTVALRSGDSAEN